jgi:hypothetical protein
MHGGMLIASAIKEQSEQFKKQFLAVMSIEYAKSLTTVRMNRYEY